MFLDTSSGLQPFALAFQAFAFQSFQVPPASPPLSRSSKVVLSRCSLPASASCCVTATLLFHLPSDSCFIDACGAGNIACHHALPATGSSSFHFVSASSVGSDSMTYLVSAPPVHHCSPPVALHPPAPPPPPAFIDRCTCFHTRSACASGLNKFILSMTLSLT